MLCFWIAFSLNNLNTIGNKKVTVRDISTFNTLVQC